MKTPNLTPIPLGERVIVEPIVEKQESELFLAESKLPPATQGIIKAVSEQVTTLKVGDVVQFSPNTGVPLLMVDNAYLLMRVGDIICKFVEV
jgi:co-chaperonin GroES (HSP10)